MDTHVYYSNMISSVSQQLDTSLVYPYKVSSFEETRSEYRKSEIYSASVLLRKVFLKHYGKDFEIYVDECGKPHALNDEVFFNISHSNGMVMVAISGCRVGCDIQCMVDKTDYDNLARRFFSEKEHKNITKSHEKAQLFYKYWTYRESYCKMNGAGLAKLNSRIVIDGEEICLDGEKVNCQVTGGIINNNYCYSVCTEKNTEVHLEQVDI